MAVSFDTSITGQDVSGATATKNIQFTVGNNSNRFIAIGVHAGGFEAVSTITYGGASFSRVKQLYIVNSGAGNRFDWEVWYLKNPAIGENTLTVTMNSSTQPFSFGANSWYNVDQTTPFSNSGSDSNTNSSPATVTVSSSAGEMINDFVATEQGLTPNANQTQIWKFSDTGQYITKGSSYKSSTAASMATYWTVSPVGDWGMISLSLKPSAIVSQQDNFFPLFMAGD